MRAALLITVLASSLAGPAFAQVQSAETTVTPQAETAVALDRGPVSVPQPSEKAMRYYRSGNFLWIINTIWGLLVPTLFLFTGFSARIRDWAGALGRKWFFVIVIYFSIFLLVNFVIEFPLAYYQGFVRQHAYDLSNQTFGKWFGDALKLLMVAAITGVLFLWIPYFLLLRSPRRWWLYTGLAVVPFIFFALMVSPIWIEPLFNDFGPMQDKPLESRILALADRAGIEAEQVYQVNKSVDTEAVNAYVTGFGGTRRIVLWDTIVEKLGPDELLFVMGHEMGHYALKHAIRRVLIFSLLILITLYLAHRSAGWLIERYRSRFKFDRLADIASLPLVILLFNTFAFVTIPIAFGYTRYEEHEADRFGLEITRDNHAAASAFVKLQEENLANPRPGLLYRIWRSPHPTLGARIDFCNTYKPWQAGERLRYDHLFSEG